MDSITKEIYVNLFKGEMTLLIGLSWTKHQSLEHNYFFLNSKLQKGIYLEVIVCISLKSNSISLHWVFRQLMTHPSLVRIVISSYSIIYSGSKEARVWIWDWCWWSYMRLSKINIWTSKQKKPLYILFVIFQEILLTYYIYAHFLTDFTWHCWLVLYKTETSKTSL